jgi:AraC family transcriptional activator of pobA
MQKAKKSIPVYDICTIGGQDHKHPDIIAEPFASYLKVHPNLHAPHRHSFYHLVLFTKGRGSHTIDFERFDVAKGQLYFMSPGQVHSWNFQGEVDGYIINFSEQLFQRFLASGDYLDQFSFFQSIAKESVFKLDDKTFVIVRDRLGNIASEVSTNSALAADLICAQLIEVFVNVQRGISRPTTKAPAQNLLILQNFRKLVNTYYAEKRLPKEYAAMLYVTPNHLNALCSDLLGRSAGEVIRDRILLESKRLLVNATLGISEIAFQLGFSDNSHFTRFFKKHTDHTPEDFRKTFITNR